MKGAPTPQPPRFNPLHYGEGFLTNAAEVGDNVGKCFNPLHYGEGFLTRKQCVAPNRRSTCFNPLHYGEGFLTPNTVVRLKDQGFVSIPCITGRVS